MQLSVSSSPGLDGAKIGTSDKFPSGMFVTNHFNIKKENTRYIQPSIMQHRITFIGEFYHQS
jgi:hypothetical protein